jgi:ABC-type lipoprotein export system ATPase subunit
MSTEQLVRCEGVSRTYGSGHAAVHAVRDASCAIFTAQRIVLMGPSGSGKSTLLHLIAGLDVPTSGSVTWPALGDRATLRPGPVAVVLQGRSLLPPLNVSENVALPLILGGASADEAGERASAALTRLSLQALGPKLPEELSGGQAQRVAIARAIAQEPRLLLADEPTGQLDRVTAAAVVDLLIEVADETGAALVVGTHEQELAKSFDESWTMSDGLLVAPLPSRLSPDGEPCSA